MNVRQIAKAAGVSPATVSRSLSGESKVNPATRQKVLAAAEKLGYEPHPLVTRMMSTLRRRRITSFRGNLAILIKNLQPGLLTDARCEAVVDGAQHRATELGFSLDRLDLDDVCSSSLERILHHRGIEGVVIFMPSFAGTKVSLEMNLDPFCCVSAGWGLWQPELDTVQVDYHQHMRLILEHAIPHFGSGIAAIWDFPTDSASHGVAQGAFLTHHPAGVPLAHKLFLGRDQLSRAKLAATVQKHDVNCLILGSSFIPPDWLSAIVPPENWIWCRNPTHQPYFGRMEPQNPLLGEWAINLLVAKLQMNQLGLPTTRQSVLLPGRWIPGQSSKSNDPTRQIGAGSPSVKACCLNQKRHRRVKKEAIR